MKGSTINYLIRKKKSQLKRYQRPRVYWQLGISIAALALIAAFRVLAVIGVLRIYFLYSFSDFLYFTCLPFAIVALIFSIKYLRESPFMIDYLNDEIARLEGGEYKGMDPVLTREVDNRSAGLMKKERKLKALYEAGAITKAEYEEARKKYGLDY